MKSTLYYSLMIMSNGSTFIQINHLINKNTYIFFDNDFLMLTYFKKYKLEQSKKDVASKLKKKYFTS
jgi:hypothetical protein